MREIIYYYGVGEIYWRKFNIKVGSDGIYWEIFNIITGADEIYWGKLYIKSVVIGYVNSLYNKL